MPQKAMTQSMNADIAKLGIHAKQNEIFYFKEYKKIVLKM